MMNRIILLFVFVLFPANISFAEILAVKGDNVNLRSEPSTQSSVKWEYGKGFPLKVVDRKGEWLKVADFENDTGWIHKSLLDKRPHVIVKVNKNSTKYINIRSGPSTDKEIVGKAYYGVVFQQVEVKSGWVKVLHETGLEGWIKGTLLWGL